MTDSDFMIAKVVVLGAADIVSCPYASSQRTCMFKQSGPLFIDSYSVALLVVDIAILFPMRPQAKHILLTLACLLVGRYQSPWVWAQGRRPDVVEICIYLMWHREIIKKLPETSTSVRAQELEVSKRQSTANHVIVSARVGFACLPCCRCPSRRGVPPSPL